MLRHSTVHLSFSPWLYHNQFLRTTRFLFSARRPRISACILVKRARSSRFLRTFSAHHNLCQHQGRMKPAAKPSFRENIYTLPNMLTFSRILACPVLGWSILEGDFRLATALLFYAGLTDLVDGFLARRYKMQSIIGTILDPAADKILMTTLTITLTMRDLLPLPLGVIILGRDGILSLAAFYIRYTSLAEPKTFARYWDFSLPSAEIQPTGISKVNTALQLVLMGTTTVSPLLPFDLGLPFVGLQLMVATTTIWSGLSYVFSKNAVRMISERRDLEP